MTMRNMSDGKSQTNVSVHSTTSDATEKQGVHGASQTPHLDRQLQTPQSKDILQALIVSLNDIADENQCTKCAVENASTLLTGYVREVRAAKRSGQWSKEEKKALKKEIKALGRGVKRDVKKLWHEDH
ncbi:hypothetical protein ETB97_008502 [Aspergillus alliaceus]|uniref:Uncharacterized protein n=1 Tax=Petromyces alliaceus TaxID=209559 RepID=A0A8H6ABN0_PETAA|nr:hypothetical protein ETB97_008502 [Aspergillus burnettii]